MAGDVVGREAELAEIHAFLDRSMTGRRTLILEGEPGDSLGDLLRELPPAGASGTAPRRSPRQVARSQSPLSADMARAAVTTRMAPVMSLARGSMRISTGRSARTSASFARATQSTK